MATRYGSAGIARTSSTTTSCSIPRLSCGAGRARRKRKSGSRRTDLGRAGPMRPNGVATEYQFDAASRLTGLTYKAGSTILGTLTYALDPVSNRNQQAGAWARTTLPPAVASATYNAANQQMTFGAQALSYDLNGNLISDGTTTYAWDARDRLVSS